ncbi:putative amidophosphoribosyltransferase [Microbacterium sp. ZKA21]|uniref:ComF family protein n=1 Tax=Microbacterium sp. ZKA21 TaxID=3381694 RepID=UPI003D1C5A67
MPERDTDARLIDEILSVLLGASCAGCDEPGRVLCDGCRELLRAAPAQRVLTGGLSATAALSFEGVAARCIRAVKEEGSTLLVRPLAAALHEALPSDPKALLVPVPTSRASFRRRGYRVPEMLVRACGRRTARLLAHAGGTEDQRGLGRAARERNVAGSMRARHLGAGEEVVLVDDVITTGSTLVEAAEVLSEAGFRVRGAVALAATPKRR